MGRIVTQLKLANFACPDKMLTVSALVDTDALVVVGPGEVSDLAPMLKMQASAA